MSEEDGGMQMSELNNPNPDSWYHAYNPLLDGIPVFKELIDVMDAIAFDPLENIDISSISFEIGRAHV